METHFLAGILRPIFWLLIILPLLALLRWGLGKFIRPRLPKRLADILFRRIS